MLSTENSTLERIQREIKDVMEREKELKHYHTNNNNNNNEEKPVQQNGIITMNGTERPPLLRAQSTSVLVNGDASKTNNFRRFNSNPHVKGVMHRFLKSRGKVNAVNAISNGKSNPPQWTPPNFSAPKLTAEQTKRIRNGFIPVEERLRKEILAEHEREIELRSQRRKSQPEFNAILDLDEPLEPPKFGLRATKSMAQLYDSTENLVETTSAPSSLKPARSLAELCDAGEDEVQTPQSLIMRFEKMIIQNKETART